MSEAVPDHRAHAALTAAHDLQMALAEARAEADRFRACFEWSGSGQALTDLEGRLTEVNARFCEMLGYSREALIGKHFRDISHPDEHGDEAEKFAQLAAGCGKHFQLEKRFVRADGSLLWCALTVALLCDADGTPREMTAVIDDIDERRRLHDEVAERDAVLQAVSRHMPSALIVYSHFPDGSGHMAYVSPRLRELFEMEPDDPRDVLEVIRDRIDPDARTAMGEAVVRSAQTMTELQLDFVVTLPRSGQRWLSGRSSPRREANCVTWYGAITDITEYKLYQAALVNAEAAEKANRAKSEFLSRMSHELRTPLNAVIGFAQLLRLDATQSLSTAQRHRVGLIEQAGAHLLAMITEVLDLARVEAGRLPLSIESVQLQRLVGDATSLVSEAARAAQVEVLAADVHPALHVSADLVRLRQVLVNLLSNAVKYNRPGGTIQVRAEPAGAFVAISVTDTGLGLTPEQQQHLFEPFNRLGAEASAAEGTGIGLVIMRRLVELMQGQVQVRSTRGQGSTFTVELPIAQPLDVRDLRLPPATTPPTRQARSATLLYAEDNEVNVMLLEQVLALRPEWTLKVASSGRQTLAMARASAPDLLLLDMHLGDMTGFDVAHELDKDPVLAAIPRLALSADAMPDQIHSARRRGFKVYLTKPLDVLALLECLDAELDERPLGQTPTAPTAPAA